LQQCADARVEHIPLHGKQIKIEAASAKELAE
jgi:hypothetical protein